MFSRIETCCLMAGSEFPASLRFCNDRLLSMGQHQFSHDVLLPSMTRQGTTSITLFNLWGWSAGPDGKPAKDIDLDARRLCQANPQTRHLADIKEMVNALSLLKSHTKRVSIYVGNPFNPVFAHYTDAMWKGMAKAIAEPFRGLVDCWIVDVLSASNGHDCGAVFAQYLAEAGDCEVGGEPRPLYGKVAPRITVCEANKWQSSGAAAGDHDHLPLSALPHRSEVHIIQGTETQEKAMSWVKSGAFYMLGTSSVRRAWDFVEAD